MVLWFTQLFCAFSDVRILLWVCISSCAQTKCLREEIHHTITNRKCIQSSQQTRRRQIHPFGGPFTDSIRYGNHSSEHTVGDRRMRLSEADAVHRHFAEHNYAAVVRWFLLQRVRQNEKCREYELGPLHHHNTHTHIHNQCHRNPIQVTETNELKSYFLRILFMRK